MSLARGNGALNMFYVGPSCLRLLDRREGYGPKTVKAGYSNVQEKTRKTEIGDQRLRALVAFGTARGG
jgi:hypothetical protein